MGAKVTFDYAEYFRNQKRGYYPKIAELIRKGDISDLSHEARNLLADYLEKKPNRTGRPSKDNFELAGYLYREFKSLQRYGRTQDDVHNYIQENITAENHRSILEQLKTGKMKREIALDALANNEDIPFNSVKKHVEAYESYLKKYPEMR